MSKFQPRATYQTEADYCLLPFTFTSLSEDEYVVTNMVGESAVLSGSDVQALTEHRLKPGSPTLGLARSKQFIYFPGEKSAIELLALKFRTRHRLLPEFTNLHMMVVTLRCDHSCPYCQVSRQSTDRQRFDMSEEIADRSLDLIFESPARALKIEFQGGEPLLNFELIQYVVRKASNRAQSEDRNIEFVIATTLSLVTDDILDFCAQFNVMLSTSLDGPRDLHNKNRPRPGHDSYERFVAGLSLARDRLGIDRISALMTTTQNSLSQVEGIIDEYVALGFSSIFLRPISPYGFAMKTKSYSSYGVDQWLDFYKRGLHYIISLNRAGIEFREIYTSIILKKMMTHSEAGYVDLMSPAGIGIAGVVYNYDGDVYASDESRMLAEMGDTTFRLGSVLEDSYASIFGSESLIRALEESFTLSVPMCSDCAFEPYCGSDPVFHHKMYGDTCGRKPESDFCKRNMAIFRHIFELRKDPEIDQLFLKWGTS